MAARSLTRALVALLPAAALACGDAARDRVLVVHSPLPEALREYAEAAFERDHPTVDVRVVERASATTLEELATSSVEVDVWWGGSAVHLAEAAAAGHLAAHRPGWLAQPGVGELDPEGRWQPVLVSPFVIAFDRERVELARAPTDWVDLFHQRWRGDILLLDPTSDPATAEFMAAMVVAALRDDDDLQRGFDWLARLDAATGAYQADVDALVRRLAAGEAALTVLPRHMVEEARHGLAPGLYYRFPESGTPMLTAGVALLADAPEPELARAFIEIVGGGDVQTVAKLHTRWMPAHGDVDMSRLPEDFEIDAPWRPWRPAVDTLAAELPGWLERWNLDVRGRGAMLF